MKYSSIFLLFILAIAVNVALVQAGYSVDTAPLPAGPSDTLGAESTISFFELPLWIQVAWAAGGLIAVLAAIKFGPLVLGKVRIILQNENRASILEYIADNPGCTLADCSKNTGVNRGTAKYHLYLLLIGQKVVRKKFGKLGYLFANGGTHLERKRVYGYIMNPAKREILPAIIDQPGISNKEIATRVQSDPSTIHWHLGQLLEEKMVASQRIGRNVNYVLFPDVEAILRESQK